MKKLIFSWAGTAKSWKAISNLRQEQSPITTLKVISDTIAKGMGLSTTDEMLCQSFNPEIVDQQTKEAEEAQDEANRYMEYIEDKSSRWGERE